MEKNRYVANLLRSELSDMSKKQYISRLKRLEEITGYDIDWILINCNETMDLLESKGITEPQTKRSYINSVLALYKYNPKLKDDEDSELEKWRESFKRIDKITEHKYKTLEASAKQIEVYVPWHRIVETRDKLDKNSDDYLLLSMYTMIEPARADMNKVKLIWNREPSEEEKREDPNYLLIKSGNNMTLVYNEFKSKSRRLQKYENELPKQLQDVIKQSLKIKPREYLIVSPRTNKPYANAHSYTVYVDRRLEKIFGKRVTINTLRHSYINSLDMNMNPLQKETIARNMMHSVSTMEKYRLVIPDYASRNRQKQLCEVKCKPAY